MIANYEQKHRSITVYKLSGKLYNPASWNSPQQPHYWLVYIHLIGFKDHSSPFHFILKLTG